MGRWGAGCLFQHSPALNAAFSASASQNYRKSSRHLAPFISKFVQFTHQYITHNAPAAVSFLQKHSDALQ